LCRDREDWLPFARQDIPADLGSPTEKVNGRRSPFKIDGSQPNAKIATFHLTAQTIQNRESGLFRDGQKFRLCLAGETHAKINIHHSNHHCCELL
jgi:hypothetical protein